MFFDTFKMLCEKRGVSCNRAAREIGLSNSTPTKWKKTGAVPDGSTLAKVSAYFNVPIESLLGEPQDGADLNMLLRAVAEAYNISWEEATEIHQILQRPEWCSKCGGFGLMESFALYFNAAEEKASTPETGGGRSETDQRLDELLAQASEETKQAMVVLLEQKKKQK